MGAQWDRIEAARRDTSVSRLLGALLKEGMTAQDAVPEGHATGARAKTPSSEQEGAI